jgi:SOCS box
MHRIHFKSDHALS